MIQESDVGEVQNVKNRRKKWVRVNYSVPKKENEMTTPITRNDAPSPTRNDSNVCCYDRLVDISKSILSFANGGMFFLEGMRVSVGSPCQGCVLITGVSCCCLGGYLAYESCVRCIDRTES